MTVYIVTVKTDNGGQAFLAHTACRAVFADKQLAQHFLEAVQEMLAITYGKEKAEWVPADLREQEVIEKPENANITAFVAALIHQL